MANMYGVDVSHWQLEEGFNPALVPADFVIVKSSQGNSYKDPTFKKGIESAIAAGKLVGVYHFADGQSSGKEEARHFLNVVRPYVGNALLVLDWEAKALAKGTGYALEFSDEVYAQTKVKTILYCSLSTINRNWKLYAAKYPDVWPAKYGSNQIRQGYTASVPAEGASVSPFKREIIRQYSSHTYLPGFHKRLDANKAYIGAKQWIKLCQPRIYKAPTTVDEVVELILMGDGEWAVKQDARRAKLIANGFNPDEVQAKINALLK